MKKPVLLEIGGQGQPLLFAHANGYPPGSYRQFFASLCEHFTITAVEHRPLWGEREPPRRLRWQLFVDDLLVALRDRYDAPAWVMGHSMGGTIAALAARREPGLFRGLVLLDPVFLPDRWVIATQLMPERQRRQMPMIRRALGRPEFFESHEEAFAFYRSKRAFRGLSDTALRDYVEASKQTVEEGGVQLRYSGAWEAAVYGSAPRVASALKRLTVPTLGLRGRDSDTLRPDMWSRWHHWQPRAQFLEVAGGHLFPLEHPRETADAITGALFSH